MRTRALEDRVLMTAPNVFRPTLYVGGRVIVELISQGSGEKIMATNFELASEVRRERILDKRPAELRHHVQETASLVG